MTGPGSQSRAGSPGLPASGGGRCGRLGGGTAAGRRRAGRAGAVRGGAWAATMAAPRGRHCSAPGGGVDLIPHPLGEAPHKVASY